MRRPQLVPGGILLVLGALFLLDALDVADAGSIIGDWWPLVIVAIGLVRLLDRPTDLPGGLTTVAIGAVLLGFTLDVVDAAFLSIAWPVVLIVLGLYLVLSRGSRAPAGVDAVSATVVLSGRTLTPQSDRFRGGSLVAVFGGIDLDLRGSELAPEGAHLDVTVAFGGVDIKVPPGWRVRTYGPAIFGGYDNHAQDQHLPADAPSLDVRVVAAFGGAEVKLAAPRAVPFA
jgi:hypothetical protein